MHIALIDLKDPRDLVVDKTIAGGMGTATRYGKGTFGGILTRLKAQLIRLLPYNVAYVAAILRAQGHSVAYRENLEALDFDLAILFSAIPSRTVDGEALHRLRLQGIPAIVVGTIAGVAPESYEESSLILKGEPEAFFMDPQWPTQLADWPEGSGKLMDVGQVQTLDALPHPDWSVFPKLSSSYAVVRLGATVLPVVTSRGCPYPCGYYCPYPLGEGKTMRFRSPESVVDELRQLKSRHGVTAVKFRDPIFTVHRKRTMALLDTLDSAKLGVAWGCETHLAQLDEALLERMAATGCTLIQTGVETINPTVLKASKRKSAEIVHQERMLELARNLGIKTAIYFIVGLPEDTVESMSQSLDYAATLPATFIQITACTPYPGTRFFEDVEGRLLTRDWRDLDQYTPVLKSDHFSSEALLGMMSYGYRRFYLRRAWIKNYLKVTRAAGARFS